MTERRGPPIDRRSLLKRITAGAATGSLAAAGATASPSTGEAQDAAVRKRRRYQVSAHIKDYYRTNRY